MMITLPNGPSENGLSKILSANGCARRAALFEEDRSAGLIFPSPDWSAVGVKGHALLEHYHTGRLALADLAGVEFGPAGHPALIGETAAETTAEALRIAEWYFTEFPSARFGSVVGAEIDLTVPTGIFEGLTARLDLVSDIPEGAIEGVPAGRFISDHKFYAKTPSDYAYLLRSLQAIWYCRAWELVHGERVTGFLYNVITKTKVPKNIVRWRPFPEEDEIAALENTLSVLAARIAREGPWANAAACYDDHGKECVFLTNGRCPRY